MSQTVLISGNELEYFKGIVNNAVRGTYGAMSAVEITINDSGQIQFSTNGYSSAPLGTTTSSDETNSVATDSESNGNGNGKVSKRDLAARVERLEQFVADVQATGLLPSGVRLR